MPIPKDLKLYEDVKKYIDTIYTKPSAYKSGAIVKEYKKRGGTYMDDNKPKNLKRWFQENWISVNEMVGGDKNDYPTYRPTKKISSNTPATVNQIPLQRLREQYKLKQKIKGTQNLPTFL